MADNRAKITFRVPEDRREELKIAGARRRQTVQEMLEDGLRLLLEAKGEGKPHALPTAAPKAANVRWHAMLDKILADKEERIGIEKNLQWAVDSIDKKAATRTKRVSTA